MISNYRTAFILQIHTNPDQVNLFVNQLVSGDQADVFIHIDQKNLHHLSGKLLSHPNVRILEQSVSCEWGDISQVDATILLLREVLSTNKQYDFVCLRSGQDLMVKNGFKELLRANPNRIYMNFRLMSGKSLGMMQIRWPKITRKRYTTAHPIRIYRWLLLYLFSKGIKLYPNKNNWPEEYSFYKGSQWFTIPYGTAKYIVEFLDENDWYYRFFENALVPDESFFQTLIMNSPYKYKVVNNNLYFIKWGETIGERNSPQNLMINDIEAIEKSQSYFARKFDDSLDEMAVTHFIRNVLFEKNKSRD